MGKGVAIFKLSYNYLKIISLQNFMAKIISKIEKEPRGIRGEKSNKDMANSKNLVSTIGAQTSPIMRDEPGIMMILSHYFCF